MVSIWTNAVTDIITAMASMVTMVGMVMEKNMAMVTVMAMGKKNSFLDISNEYV